MATVLEKPKTDTFALLDLASFLRKLLIRHFSMSVIVDVETMESNFDIEARMLDMLEGKKGASVVASPLGYLPLIFPEKCDWNNKGIVYSLKTGKQNSYKVACEIFNITFEQSLYLFAEKSYKQKDILPKDVAKRISEVCAYGFPIQG